MFGLKLTIVPTGALTFRRVPFSTVHLATYPFLPPTTMSGYLERLARLAEGRPLPGARLEGKAALASPPTYALPRQLHALGAYPTPSGAWTVHRTRRQGIREFSHTAFSRMVGTRGDKENYQLYTWEYLLVERLTGYVLCEEKEPLKRLQQAVNFGYKIGKEGYAFLETAEGPICFERKRIRATPSTLVPAQEVIGLPGGTLFTLYRYDWDEGRLPVDDASPIRGFVPFRGVLLDSEVQIETEYWTDGTTFIPVSLLEAF